MAFLVSDLIGQSFLDGGMTAAGETPNASELADGLLRLNSLVDSLNGEGATLPSRQIDTLALSGGTLQKFTMGPSGGSGDIATGRPTRVLGARCYLTASGLGRGLKVITDPKEWASLAERGSAFTLPLMVYPDYQYPNVILHFTSAPTASTDVDIDILESFSTFAPDTPSSLQEKTQMVVLRSNFTMTLTANVSAYQVGPTASGTGAVVRSRPAQILAASAGPHGGTFRHPLDVVGSAQFQAQLEPDNQPLLLPMACYPVYAYPNATINLWPVAGAGVTAEIQSPQLMTQFAALGQDLASTSAAPTGYPSGLPPAWLKMLHFVLAVDLYPEYRRNQGIPQELMAAATDAKAAVLAMNMAAGVLVPPQQQAPVAQ